MRAHLTRDEDAQPFAKFLLQIGNGSYPTNEDNMLEIPVTLPTPTDNTEDLISHVFPDLQKNYTDKEWMCSRAILATTNKSVDEINETILHTLPGELHTYRSADTVPLDQNPTMYPVEFLNTLTPSGIPPHQLTLKTNTPIMLLRNLNPSQRQCNGSRYIITSMTANLIHALPISDAEGSTPILIPRIPMMPADNLFPFKFYRRQFPVRPSFAMTINKSQGQTLQQAGLLLHKPVFTHGQLYVAMSRVGSSTALKLMTTEHTNNSYFTKILSTQKFYSRVQLHFCFSHQCCLNNSHPTTLPISTHPPTTTHTPVLY